MHVGVFYCLVRNAIDQFSCKVKGIVEPVTRRGVGYSVFWQVNYEKQYIN